MGELGFGGVLLETKFVGNWREQEVEPKLWAVVSLAQLHCCPCWQEKVVTSHLLLAPLGGTQPVCHCPLELMACMGLLE